MSMTSQKARFSTQRQQQSCIVLCNTLKTLYSYIVTITILSRQPQEDTENGGVLSSEMDGEKIAFRFGFEGKSINYAKKSIPFTQTHFRKENKGGCVHIHWQTHHNDS